MGVAFISVFAACNTKKDETKRDMLFLTDTSSLNISADTAVVVPAAAVVAAPAAAAASRNTAANRARTTTRRSTSANNGTYSNSGSSNNNGGNVATAPARKKGWSKAAKGAAIGGVAGAATGAIITKSGKGAIIGGVIGAGGGYIIGRSKDRKDGRVN